MEKMGSAVPEDPNNMNRAGYRPTNLDASPQPVQSADSTIFSQEKLKADLQRKLGSSQTTSPQSQLSQWGNQMTSEPSMPINTNATADVTTRFKNKSTRTESKLLFQGQGGGKNVSETSAVTLRPHIGSSIRWDAISAVSRGSPLRLNHFRLLKRFGYGDIGSVYLVKLRGVGTRFVIKITDKTSLASRNKLLRSWMEREILSLLDYLFLPTLYSYSDMDYRPFSCSQIDLASCSREKLSFIGNFRGFLNFFPVGNRP